MPRFSAIEGLRATLAWAVVLSHIGQSVGIEMLGGHWVWFARRRKRPCLSSSPSAAS